MLHIITFGTDDTRLKYLKESARLSNLEIHYTIKSTWDGYIDKILYTREFLEGIPDTDIVCFVDAYDVLALASAEEILAKFKSYDCDLVLGAEMNSYPERYRQYYPSKEYTTNSLYVNSGGYIGYRHAIYKLLTWQNDDTIRSMCSNTNGGDQTYFIEYYLRNPHAIKLDTWQKIFQNMHWVSWNELYIHRGRVINVELNQKPCFIHFNGGTWQTKDEENILPVFVNKLRASADDTNIYTLHEYIQLRSDTCWPHKQIN
jgi:hypothetical protein